MNTTIVDQDVVHFEIGLLAILLLFELTLLADTEGAKRERTHLYKTILKAISCLFVAYNLTKRFVKNQFRKL